jgi:hypothetical protein
MCKLMEGVVILFFFVAGTVWSGVFQHDWMQWPINGRIAGFRLIASLKDA